MVLVAFANTPEDFRREVIKLIGWSFETQSKNAKNAGTKREQGQCAHAAHVLRNVIDDLERVHIEPLKTDTKPAVDLVSPVLNLNGTSAKSLIDGYCDAVAALTEGYRLMRAAGPHGRDYQTAPAGLYEKARAQHEARVLAVEKICQELETMALNVQEQEHGRRG